MPSFSIPLTGLEADSTALNTIGNNLANLNTTAFKDQSTTFSDLFYQQLGTSGSGDPILAGVGTEVSGTSTDFTQGTLATTGTSTDMAIQGNGFFVVDQNGQQELTRAGNFSLDSGGNLITSAGQNVLGYSASDGAITNTSNATALQVPVGAVENAQATSSLTVEANLNSAATSGTSFSQTMTLYDSLGTAQNATVTFTNAGSNTWNYSIALPSTAYTGSAVNSTGTLTFNSSGQLETPASNVSGSQFTGMADGAADMNFSFALYDAAGNPTISESASASAIANTNQNGYTSGTYEGFTVDSNGIVSAQYNNGESETVGEVAIANVTNVEGLAQQGSNDYAVTTASGGATVGVAGLGGNGTIQDDALEQSNVDISTEFANLIVAQRAFEANSKAVTTFDTVTQETINLIH
jgi:flagellar hook protein FlgE